MPLKIPAITLYHTNYWGQLHGCAIALALTTLCQSHNSITLIITPDNLSARQLQAELDFFQHNQSGSITILEFPDWETLPYDQFSPHQDIISQRLLTLSQFTAAKPAIVVTALTTLMHRLAPPEFVHIHSLVVTQGDRLDLEIFRTNLQQAGYHFTSKVMEHGECAIRGSIIDVYPMGSALPYRIDLYDDIIESIRTFDPDNQRSVEVVTAITLLPAREFPLNQHSMTQFRKGWRQHFAGNASHCPIYNDISEGIIPAGIEYYLPLFFEKTYSLFDYLPANALLVQVGNLHDAGAKFWQEAKLRYTQRSYDITRPILPPPDIFIPIEAIFAASKRFSSVTITDKASAFNFSTAPAPDLAINRKSLNPLEKLQHYLTSNSQRRYLLCAETPGRREVLIELLQAVAIHPHIYASWQEFVSGSAMIGITYGALTQGSELLKDNIAIIVEAQLFGEPILQQRRRVSKSFDINVMVRDLTELRIGSPVVHLEHGIGRYLGLQHLALDGQINEFLIIEYAAGDKIYVPVTSLHMISRYTGNDQDHAPLHRLGTDQWQKEKKKATEKITDVAIELLDIYAKREARLGFAYAAPDTQYQNFATAFPFEETPDQQQAIEHIIKDMQSKRPMDRLICGDVGFGKTEVAMRAAFLAVQNGKQVCVLVPTTLLGAQHYENFCDRFADFPINIALISRFRTHKETETVINKLHQGSVDIVIGTHKLLSVKTQFNNLGLLIIDEEHRFGVKQKEFIKNLRHEIDILCLTATPIPRTLNMSFAGLRDISIIATPPAKRLAIKTFWQEKNEFTIREALLREIMRGGQVFYLHNNIATIQKVASELSLLVAEASIEIAHGQMRERQLEKIMSDFYHHRFNVLVCTTIIETGIDIPTANTIIIERADTFGMAQLHQLRGRVGRSHHQAYAYLLTPNRKSLTADAVKRLEAITSLEDLGAGFSLATHDLEIRGAGELLGAQQSGNMQAIGFTLYTELLERAVSALKSGKKPELAAPLQQGPEIDLKISVIIPEAFIADVHSRLTFYKRIASALDTQQLRDLQVELIDRFGLLPIPVKNLFRITELKLLAQQLGITKIRANAQGGKIEFSTPLLINPEIILKLIQVHSKIYKLDGPTALRFIIESQDATQRIDGVAKILTLLSGN